MTLTDADQFLKDTEATFGEKFGTVLEACEAFYMNGLADDVGGDVEQGGHFYRVDRWIVGTDSQGFRDLFTYENENQAKTAFAIFTDGFGNDG